MKLDQHLITKAFVDRTIPRHRIKECQAIVDQIKKEGFEISLSQAYDVWEYWSSLADAQWLTVNNDDPEFVEALRCFVNDHLNLELESP